MPRAPNLPARSASPSHHGKASAALAERGASDLAGFELASPGWMEAMLETVGAAMAGVDLDGGGFIMAESFTDLPSGVAANDGEAFSWHLQIDGRDVNVRPGAPPAWPDLHFILAYPVGVELARMVYGDDPAVHAARDRIVAAALLDGRIRIEGAAAAMPEPVRTRMSTVHDHMAVRTL